MLPDQCSYKGEMNLATTIYEPSIRTLYGLTFSETQHRRKIMCFYKFGTAIVARETVSKAVGLIKHIMLN